MRCERRSTRTIGLRRHPVIALIWSALVTLSTFAACPDCPQTPAENAPHFDSEHYLTGDWFGLRNKLYDWGVEITGGSASTLAGSARTCEKRSDLLVSPRKQTRPTLS